MLLTYDEIVKGQSNPAPAAGPASPWTPDQLASAAQSATIPTPTPTVYPRTAPTATGTSGTTGTGGTTPPSTPTPPGVGTDLQKAPPQSYVGGDGKTYYYDSSGKILNPNGGPLPNPDGSPAAPASVADTMAQMENSKGVQTQIDAIRKNFTDAFAVADQEAEGRNKETNYSNVARGLIGSPDAGVAEDKTNKTNASIRQSIADQQAAQIAQVMGAADSQALQLAQLEQQKYETDYNNWKAQKDQIVQNAKDQISSIASMSNGSWADFVKSAPDSAQKLLDQSGYDPSVMPFIFNQLKAKNQQITWDSSPVQNPDGTMTIIGHDPTKTGPDSIVRQRIDNAPDGMSTVVVGGLPYWKDSNTGALYQVPSDKGQMITLKDANGTNYLYNTYTRQMINPLGADTSGSGLVSPNAPQSPLTPNSTLANLMGYYVNGDPNQTPGSGYMGAVMQALGVTDPNSVTLDQLQQRIPDLMAGIIKAEGSPVLENTYNNGGAILWSTAKAYGFDTMFNATPVELNGSNGKKMTYAAFPDKQTGQQALQSYLTSIISKQQNSQGQLDSGIANSGIGTSADKWQAQGIINGTTPPFNPTTGSISKSKGNVMAILAKNGYDLTKAWQQYQATTKFISSVNSPQQIRMRQAEQSVENSLGNLSGLVDTLNKDGVVTGFKFINKSSLDAAANGAFGSKVASDAQAVIGQLALITDELGQTFMGGNSPTDSAFDLAKGVLSKEFTYDQFNTQINLIKQNLQYRKASWAQVGAVGADGQTVDNGSTSNADNNDPLGIR